MTFPANDVNFGFQPIVGASPQQFFNCLGPGQPDPKNGLQSFSTCQVRVATSYLKRTTDEVFFPVDFGGTAPASTPAISGSSSTSVGVIVAIVGPSRSWSSAPSCSRAPPTRPRPLCPLIVGRDRPAARWVNDTGNRSRTHPSRYRDSAPTGHRLRTALQRRGELLPRDADTRRNKVRGIWKVAAVAMGFVALPMMAAPAGAVTGFPVTGYGFDGQAHVIVGGGSDTTYAAMLSISQLYMRSSLSGCGPLHQAGGAGAGATPTSTSAPRTRTTTRSSATTRVTPSRRPTRWARPVVSVR